MVKAKSPHLTEAIVRDLAAGDVFSRGRSYYEQGAVLNLSLRGDTLAAEVEGSSDEPYRVIVTLDAEGVADAECTCPYDWGGVCKHIVAALLYYIEEREQVEERPPLDTLLAGLQVEQLRAILIALANGRPDLADKIETQVAIIALSSIATSSTPEIQNPKSKIQNPKSAIDPAPFRRQVRNTLHSTRRMSGSEAYRQVGGILDEVSSVARQAVAFIEAGDAGNALTLLEAVTEEYVSGWTELDDSDGEMGQFFSELGELWAEAILSAELTSAERKTWAKRLSDWQAEVDEYGIDEGFDVAEVAATQGWDYPPLKRVLAGEIGEHGAWATDDLPWHSDTLAIIRLDILERQGRTQEYLYLAEAEGQMDYYLTMLVKLGRIEQAVSEGLKYLATPGDALSVATALHEHGAIEGAIGMAEHGLSLDGSHAELARWLHDVASEGQSELALRATLLALSEGTSLAGYQAAQSLAGEAWPELRENLLKDLREKATRHSYPRAYIEIFLHEGLVDDAIAALEADPYARYDLVEMVADAAVQSHPDWVIQAAWKQALEIIERGKSDYYSSAARWLERARDASQAAGRADEWRAKLVELIALHKRKRSLVPLLEALLKKR